MSEATLGLGGSRRENAQSPRARMLDTGKPERRLPDARFALEHECSGSCPHFVDEGVDGGKFLLPADNLERHPPHNDRDRGRDEKRGRPQGVGVRVELAPRFARFFTCRDAPVMNEQIETPALAGVSVAGL